MTGPTKPRWNVDPLWAFLLALAALGTNAGFFVNSPLPAALPWVSVAFAVVALILMSRGLRRALVHSRLYRGKALSVVLSVLTLALAGFSFFAFYGARKLPVATAAPQVGQTVPAFTLDDTNGRHVSLDSLFLPGDSNASAPKAVLLIFYRGYW